MVRIGAKLKQRARALGLSDAEVARRLDLSASRYGHYVKDVRQPDFATFLRICRILETTPNSLLGFDSDAPAVTGNSEEAVLKREIFSAVEALGLDGLRTTRTLTAALLAAGPAALLPNGISSRSGSLAAGFSALQPVQSAQKLENMIASRQGEEPEISDLDIMYSIWYEILPHSIIGGKKKFKVHEYNFVPPDEHLEFSRYLQMQAIKWRFMREYTDFEGHRTAFFVSNRPDLPRDEWVGDSVYMLSREGDCVSVDLSKKKVGVGSWKINGEKLLAADSISGNHHSTLYVLGSPDSLGGALKHDGNDIPSLCSVVAETVDDSKYDLVSRLAGDGDEYRVYDPDRDHWGDHMKTFRLISIVRADLIARAAGILWENGRAAISIS